MRNKEKLYRETGGDNLKKPALATRPNTVKKITQGIAFALGLGLGGPASDIGGLLFQRDLKPTKPLKIPFGPGENPLNEVTHGSPLVLQLPDATLNGIKVEYDRWISEVQELPAVSVDARADFKLKVESFLSFLDRCVDILIQTAPAFAMPPASHGPSAQDIKDTHVPTGTERAWDATKGAAGNAYDWTKTKVQSATGGSSPTGAGSPGASPSSSPSSPSSGIEWSKIFHYLIPLILLGWWIRSKKTEGKLDDILVKWGSLVPLLFSAVAPAVAAMPIVGGIGDSVVKILGDPKWWGAEFLWLLFPADLLLKLAQSKGRGEALKKAIGYSLVTTGWGALIISWYLR